MIGYGVGNMVRSVTPAGRHSGPRSTSKPAPALVVSAVALAVPAVLLGSWLALHRVSGLAPRVADGLRSVIGVDAVARLEDAAYRVEDRFNAVWRRGEKPRAYWAVPSASAAQV